MSVAVLARVFRRSLSVQTFALHWAVFLSLLWTAFLWAVLLSLPLAAMNLVRRVARDGLAYTLQEFQQHYGPNNWESAWAEAPRPVPPSTRQPTVHDHQPPRSGSASQPTSPVTVQLDDYGSDWESAQSTVHDHQAPRSGGVPQPAASPVTVQLDDAQAVQPSSNQSGSASQPAAGPVTVQLTFAQLESMKVGHGAGGRMAWQKQKELRALLMEQRQYEHDLTHSEWPWRNVLRALAPQMRELLAGPGVVKFSFRLLRGQPDSNYFKRDTGERHVFEIEQADGKRYHLHYHKDGKMDTPKLVPASDPGGAAQPVDPIPFGRSLNVFYEPEALPVVASAELLGADLPNPRVGRKEAQMACVTMLTEATHTDNACAIDITDELAFPWRRWLVNIAEARQALTVDIVRVFMVRWNKGGQPCITLCRINGTYLCVHPGTQQYQVANEIPVHNDWPSQEILRNPWYCGLDWLKLRATQ